MQAGLGGAWHRFIPLLCHSSRGQLCLKFEPDGIFGRNRGGVQRFTRAAEMSRGTKGTSPGAWQAVPSHCHRSMFQWAQRASHSCQRLQMRVGPGPAMRVGRSRWYEAISHFPSTETHLCCTRLCILHNLYRQLRNGRLS